MPTRISTTIGGSASSARERRRRLKGRDMKRMMTEAQKTAQIESLAQLADRDIDTDDIPEAPAENWALATRPGLYRPIKRPVTLRLDGDIVDWFKGQSGGRGYQTAINRVLRRYVLEHQSHS
jgi:uncharacterized protein (DUF4415 family)